MSRPERVDAPLGRSWREYAALKHAGTFDASRWNWCVDGNRIYIMGTGAEQCQAIFEHEGNESDGIALVEDTFGIERVLRGVG